MTVNINMPSFLVSWKSTLVGVAAILWAAIQGSNETFAVAIHDPSFQTKVLLGILGFVAKDFNTTGGTVGQPSTPAALQAANQAPSAANPPKDTK